MKLVGLLCVVVYCIVATGVAVRMLRLAGRTGQVPELLIGAAMLTGGAIGYPMWVLFSVMAAQQPEVALRAGFAGTLGLHLSAWANGLAWYAIYHRGSGWARATLGVVTAALFLSLLDRLVAVGATVHGTGGASGFLLYRISLACQALPYVLMAVTGLRYHALLERRLALGLADPVVTNRIWLWSATSAVVVVQYGWSIGTLQLRHLPTFAAASHAVVAGLGLSLAVLLSLAFFPPQFYLRRISTASSAHSG